MNRISKKNLAAKVDKAAESSPGISDRIRHANELVDFHPAHAGIGAAPSDPAPAEHAPTAKQGSRLMAVAIDLIDPNPFNARKIYRPERVNELAVSIGAHGQDVPGIATVRDGRYILAAGHYRMRAIKVLGLQTMDLMIHPNLSDKELFAFSYRENAEREGQTALDNALCWQDLLDQGLYKNETELAEITGMSLPNVNKTLRILKMSEQVIEVVKEDPSAFALSVLYELALFEQASSNQAQTIALARRVKDGEIGRKEIQEARAQVEQPKERKRKETSRPYKIARDGAAGSLKVWDSGRVMLDVVVADPALRDEVLAEIKQRFGVSE